MAVVQAATGRWSAAQPMPPSNAITDTPSAPRPPTHPATRPPRRSADVRTYTQAAAPKARPPSTNQGPHRYRYQRLMVRSAGSTATAPASTSTPPITNSKPCHTSNTAAPQPQQTNTRPVAVPHRRVRPKPISAPMSFSAPVTHSTTTNQVTRSCASLTSDGDTVVRAPTVPPRAHTKLGTANRSAHTVAA